MRRRVVFPAPLCPRSATNSPGWTSSEMPRSAASEPNRFSIFWKEMPELRDGAVEESAALFAFAANAVSP